MAEHPEPQDIAPDTEQENIARRLKEAREFLGFSQEFVADKLGVPRPAISAIETGKRKVSSIELKRFAHLYRRKVDFFLGTNDTEDLRDELLAALYRATEPLSDADRDQVLRFAAFLKDAGKPPTPRGDTEDEG
jgi:transcriptional regulator with XRE-family HTH domain